MRIPVLIGILSLLALTSCGPRVQPNCAQLDLCEPGCVAQIGSFNDTFSDSTCADMLSADEDLCGKGEQTYDCPMNTQDCGECHPPSSSSP